VPADAESTVPATTTARKPARSGVAEADGGVLQKFKGWWGEVLENAAKPKQARREDTTRKRKKEKKGDR